MKNPNGYGSVFKLGGNRRRPWCARVTIGWSDDGKQQYKNIGYYEERDWEYQVTFTHIQIELGNEFYKVAKDDLNELFELKDEIECW